MLRGAIVAAVLLPPSPLHAAPAPGAIVQLCEDWARAWRAKKLDAVMAFYTPDAVWVAGDGTRVTGTAELRNFFASALKNYSMKLDLRSINGASTGDLGYDSGDYSELVTPLADPTNRIAVHGAWLVVTRLIDGHWRIAEQFWTESRTTVGR